MSRRRTRLAGVLLVAALGVGTGAAGVRAATQPPGRGADRAALQRTFGAAFEAKRWPEAEEAALAWAESRPGDWRPIWNLACTLAAQGKFDVAEAAIQKALDLGFTDFRLLERGLPGPLADSPTVRRVLADWPGMQERAADRRAAEMLRTYGRAYRALKDPELRLIYITTVPESTMHAVAEQVALTADFWRERVLPDGESLVRASGDRTDPWVIVFLPSKADFAKWAARNMDGPLHRSAFSTVAGLYDPERFELASQDLGESFRHEFLHVLHWRHLAHLPREQPIWVMEGLASLVEGVKVDATGRLQPVATWRTNSVIRLARSAGTMPLEQLLALSREEFTAGKPLAHYALAHALLLFTFEHGKLRKFYAELVAGGAGDRAEREGGIDASRVALERSFGQPLAEVDRRFKAWLRTQPEAPE